MPAPADVTPVDVVTEELPHYAAKIKVRYFIEKRLGETWVLMARVPADCDGLERLCDAFGGNVRVLDTTTKSYVLERDFQ